MSQSANVKSIGAIHDFKIALANFADEPSTFLRLDAANQLLFSDAAMAEGIAGPSRSLLKFGAFFFDYDLDGRLDVLTCNGHLEPDIARCWRDRLTSSRCNFSGMARGRPVSYPSRSVRRGLTCSGPW